MAKQLKKILARMLGRGRHREHLPRFKWRFAALWGLARLLGARKCQNPVFIVGCPHSGTSLLLRILGAHPALHAVPYESHCGLSRAPETVFRKFDMLAWAHGRKRWVEKTPGHVHHIGSLMARFQDARFLHIIRDGRDVANSLKKKGGCPPGEGIDRWIRDNLAAGRFQGHPRVMAFTYEELVTRTDATLERILRFLGEPFVADIKNYHDRPCTFYSGNLEKPATEKGADHPQYRNWQINQPIFDGRGKWRTELTADEVALIEQRAGGMLRAHGFLGHDVS